MGGEKFPLLAYSHGLLGGGIDLLGYAELFSQMASWGFIVAAPFSCNTGCTDASKGAPWTACAGVLDVQPANMGWGQYYGEIIKAIDFARNDSAANPIGVFGNVDWSVGVGIVGHSMGGQAAALASIETCTKQYDIRASVLHHPASGDIVTVGGGTYNIGRNASVPMLVMTSSGDFIWPYSKAIATALPTGVFSTGYRDETGWSHLEPVLAPPIENPLLATYTAAWFKVFLNGDKGAFYDAVFGKGPDAMCTHANMTECWTYPPKGSL